MATKVNKNPPYVLSLLFFPAAQCVLSQVSQKTLQHVANIDLGNAMFQLVRQGQHSRTSLVFAPSFLVYLHHPRACSIIEEGRQIRVPLMKNSATHQKARLLVALASLNNAHNSNLRACCTSVRSSSKPSFVPAKPLRPRRATWRSSLLQT